MTTMNALMNGATIQRGNFGGWYLTLDGKRIRSIRQSEVDALIEAGKIVRIDDRSSVCGEEYGIKL